MKRWHCVPHLLILLYWFIISYHISCCCWKDSGCYVAICLVASMVLDAASPSDQLNTDQEFHNVIILFSFFLYIFFWLIWKSQEEITQKNMSSIEKPFRLFYSSLALFLPYSATTVIRGSKREMLAPEIQWGRVIYPSGAPVTPRHKKRERVK